MLARSPNSAATILIAAISGRALAAAARRAGYRPLVADLFRDQDTLALAERAVLLPGDLARGIDEAQFLDTLRELAGAGEPAALVLGSGFERRPALVDKAASHFPLAGNGGAAIRRVKDPATLAADCGALGIPHPETRLEPPSDPGNWLAKTAGAAGGAHVAPAAGLAAAPGRYFQRRISGRSVSALFLAHASGARIVGFSRQWTAPRPGAPYRYGGATRLLRFDRADAAGIGAWLSALAGRAGLVGLCSADFIRDREGTHWLIDVNPRPGATLDIFDSEAAPLLEAHIAACRGLPFRLPRFGDSAAAMIAYAGGPVETFPDLAWPDWAADRQKAGTRLAAGDPVCTVFARGRTAGESEIMARDRARALAENWEGGPR